MSTSTKPPVAANLRTLKDAGAVTWQAIAQALGVGERLVSAWANEEESDPSWFNVCRLAEYFGVEPCVFYMPPEWVKPIVTKENDDGIPAHHLMNPDLRKLIA